MQDRRGQDRPIRAGEERPNPDEKLVNVFDAEQESEVMVVRGLLESAGIDSDMTALDAPQDVFPVGGTIILVREEQADEALRLIEEYRRAAASEDETAKGDVDEDSPTAG